MGKNRRKIVWKPLPLQSTNSTPTPPPPPPPTEVNAKTHVNTRPGGALRIAQDVPDAHTGSDRRDFGWIKRPRWRRRSSATRRPVQGTWTDIERSALQEESLDVKGAANCHHGQYPSTLFDPYFFYHQAPFGGGPANFLPVPVYLLHVDNDQPIDSSDGKDQIRSSSADIGTDQFYPGPLHPPFLFRPACAPITAQISQQQCWPNYSRRVRGGGEGHRRGRRRGRSSWWIGGEGISYDRWPSRRKPALDSIEPKLVGKPETEKEPEIQVDMARLITAGDNGQDATGGLLLIETPLPASPNGQLPDAGTGHCDLNLLAENLVGDALKDVLDLRRRLDESLDSTLKELDVESPKQPAETYMRNGDNKYPPLSSSSSSSSSSNDDDHNDLLVNRWYIADNENHDDDVVVKRPFASSMSSRAAADASKYYKLCSSEVDDFGPNSRTSTLGDEIIIHELEDDDASECGSEDVEMFGHRYETSAEKRYKNNQVSLASEILSVRKQQQQQLNEKRDMDGDEDLKLPPISVESDEPGCYTNTQALEGYFGQIRRPPKDRRPVSDALDSGIHASDDGGGGDDEDDEILFSRRSTQSGSGSVNANFEYQPLKNPQGAVNQKTPLVVYLKSNPWYYGCCSVM